jgi:pilus assembly protein CpaE
MRSGRTSDVPTGNVITVFSPKGGTGKTVLATNIASYLASRSKKRVLLIDLDLQFGDAAIMLGLDPERTMFDLVQAGGDLDPGKLVAYTTRHRSGLDVLVAPMLPEHAELVTEERVVRLVEVAREAYDIVVVDTSPFFYGPMLALLGPTDQLLLLCGLDVPTLKNVRLSLRTLELLGYPPSRTNLVLNRVTPDVGLTVKDVEEALGVRVAFEVPNDPVVAPSVNRGAVPALKEADSDFALAVARVAAALEPTLGAPQAAVETPAAGATRLRRFVARHVAEGRT